MKNGKRKILFTTLLGIFVLPFFSYAFLDTDGGKKCATMPSCQYDGISKALLLERGADVDMTKESYDLYIQEISSI